MPKTPSTHLSPTEFNILNLLSENTTYAQIANRLKITPACLHVHVWNIRRKTGIKDTKNKTECAMYMGHGSPRDPNGPTVSQHAILSLMAKGRSYAQIAQDLKITPGTAMNQASQGCKRAGITTANGSRLDAITAYLADRAQIRFGRPGQPEEPMVPDPMF